MRIVSIVANLNRRGTQRAAFRYSSMYKKEYNKSAILGLYEGGSFEGEIKREGVKLFIGGESISEREKALEGVVKWKPDIIHIHRQGGIDQGILGAAKKVCKKIGKKIPIVETNVFARVDKSEDRKNIDLHFLLTKWCLWKWKKWGGNLNPRPVGTVLPYPIDTETFFPSQRKKAKQFRKKHDIPEESFLYTRIGGSGPSKWHKKTVTSFSKVNRRKKNTHLLLVNPPRKIISKVNSTNKRTKNNISIVDEISSDISLRRAYSTSQVFLHASKIGESFGMVLGESMACGTPVITLNTPLKDNSQVEVVNHDEGGLIAATHENLKEAMIVLLKNKSKLDKLSSGAKRRLNRNYSESEVRSRLIEKLDKLKWSIKKDRDLKKIIENEKESIESLSKWVDDKMKNMLGGNALKKRVLMPIIHSPLVYDLKNYLR